MGSPCSDHGSPGNLKTDEPGEVTSTSTTDIPLRRAQWAPVGTGNSVLSPLELTPGRRLRHCRWADREAGARRLRIRSLLNGDCPCLSQFTSPSTWVALVDAPMSGERVIVLAVTDGGGSWTEQAWGQDDAFVNDLKASGLVYDSASSLRGYLVGRLDGGASRALAYPLGKGSASKVQFKSWRHYPWGLFRGTCNNYLAFYR